MFVWCLIFMALQHVTALSRVIIPDGTRAVFQNYLGTEVGMERSKNTIQTYEDDVNSRNQADAIFMPPCTNRFNIEPIDYLQSITDVSSFLLQTSRVKGNLFTLNEAAIKYINGYCHGASYARKEISGQQIIATALGIIIDGARNDHPEMVWIYAAGVNDGSKDEGNKFIWHDPKYYYIKEKPTLFPSRLFKADTTISFIQ